MQRRLITSMVAALVLAAPLIGQQDGQGGSEAEGLAGPAVAEGGAPVDRIARFITDPGLRALVAETLVRNPAVARARARARAAERRVPQVGALPDPVAGVTAWLQGPETRTGPQVLTLNWTQGLPWLGKLDLGEQAALLEAGAQHFEVEAARLRLVTALRRLYWELGFLAAHKEITEDFLDHLRQHEEISRSRYATGMGASQDVVKIQAEITMAESLLVDIDQRRVELESQINHLRDRPASEIILPPILPAGEEIHLDVAELREAAVQLRPEVAAENARIAATEVRVRLAEKQYRPDFQVGLTYTLVDPRDDPAGIVNPPAGNGDDIVGIQGGVRIPIWRKRLKAGVEEASEVEISARESRRNVVAGIEAAIGDLLQRIPLTWQQLRLLEDILIVQAEQSVKSAEFGYVAGSFNALDLLDAEHVLYEAEIAIARAQVDYAIRLSELEGEVAHPLEHYRRTEPSQS